MRLIITQTGYDSAHKPLFTLSNGESTSRTVTLPDPAEYPVENGGKPLQKQLRWYLEQYLTYPAGGSRKRAEAVVNALEAWGAEVFDRLFDRNLYAWFDDIRKKSRLRDLQIRVISRDPAVLAWPWEALCASREEGSKKGTFFGTNCCIERLPDTIVPPMDAPGETDHLRMLLVIARPYGEEDVGYHALARAVVDYVRDEAKPVTIDVLRPPTFQNLRETLSRARDAGTPYHIVHFDGHGGYGAREPDGGGTHGARPDPDRSEKFQGAEGCLVFETEPTPGTEIKPDPIGAGVLGQMLSQCGVRMVVLNACQSAMIDEQAEDAYASVAASLLNAGIRSVTAMGYSLYVAGAKEFVPAYYEQLFRDGTPAAATREGRAKMYSSPLRPSGTGMTPLRDWIVPELYQKIPEGMRVLPTTTRAELEPDAGDIWPDGALEQDVGGFIGRGQAIQELERLLYHPAAGILIHGMAGAGKTTLAKGFLAWLRDTGGLRREDGAPCKVFWFDFRDVHSAEYLVHVLAEHLCEGGASANDGENLRRVVSVLKRQRSFLVWDNFESASGAPGTSANLSEKGREYLRAFLEKLRGGKSRVLITSRTPEEWLTGGTQRICAYMQKDLDGLHGDELWDYCTQIAAELGLTLSDKDREEGADLAKLLKRLDGNPLAVRSVLLRLRDTEAADLNAELVTAFHGAKDIAGKSTDRIQAAFDMLMRGVAEEEDADLAPVLRVVGLHEHYADADYVFGILWQMDESTDPNSPEARKIRESVTRCFALLESAGLCTHIGQNIYRVHPALRGCLAERYPAPDDVRRWFAEYMDYVRHQYHNDDKQRRAFFSIHEANIRHAREIAGAQNLADEDLSLTVGLAANASDRGDFAQAEALLLELAERARRHGRPDAENRAYSWLSALASQRGDSEAEKQWSQKAADVWKNAKNLSADVLFTLGNNADTQGDLQTAMKYWEQAAELHEKEGDDRHASIMYGLLGNTAAQMGDLDTARKWLLKGWEAAKARGDVGNMAAASSSLAALAKNLSEAEDWYHRSIALFEQIGEELYAAQTRWALGDLYVQAELPDAAREQFTEAVRVAKRLDVKPTIADCYDGLGHVALMEGSPQEARAWWEEALKICEELNDEKRLARVRGKLRRLDGEPETPDFEEMLKLLSEHPEMAEALLQQLSEDPELKELLEQLGDLLEEGGT